MTIQKKTSIISLRSTQLIVLTLVYIYSLLICDEQHIDTFRYSVGYVTLTLTSFTAVWYSSNRQINLYILYLLAFSLFIGGRFWVGLVDNDIDLFTPSFFFSYNVKAKNASDLMTWVYSFLYFATVGYVLFRKRNSIKNNVHEISMNAHKCETIAKLVFPIVLASILYQGITEIVQAFSYGYGVSLDDVTSQGYNKSYVKAVNSVFGVMMLAFTYVYARNQYPKYLKLYFIYGVLILIGGSRFSFAAILLVFIWLYSRDHNIGLSKILLYGIIGVMTLLVLFSLSARGTGLANFSIFDAFEIFLYTTGGSLMVFDASTLVDGYPWVAYIQTIIPGATLIYSKISTQVLHMQDLTFQGHMCYELNPGLYASGAGLGWTTLSDLYLFSGANIMLFCLLAVCFGLYFAFMENKADTNLKYRFVLISISQGVLMMPRGTSAPMFVGAIYALIFVYILKQYMLRRGRNFLRNEIDCTNMPSK